MVNRFNNNATKRILIDMKENEQILEMIEKIKEILIKEFERVPMNERSKCDDFSLCTIAEMNFDYRDSETFKEYLLKHSGAKTFFNRDGEVVGSCRFWHWHPMDFESRLKWLNEHIKLNS